MVNKKQKFFVLGVVVLALCALILGLLIAKKIFVEHTVDVTKFHGTLLSQPRTVEPFKLEGIDHQAFTEQSLSGQWTMLFFGFADCGYLCPTTLSELNKMMLYLQHHGVKKLPRVVFITIDPKRDDLEKLRHYVKAFNPNFYAARGDETSIQQLAQTMGIAYAKLTSSSKSEDEGYQIEHSGTIILFNPKGQLNGFFTTPHHARLLGEDYLLLTA